MTSQTSDSGIMGLLDALLSRVHVVKRTLNPVAELDELDEYIKKTRAVLQVLVERRNTVPSIIRLPAEILTSIFEGIQKDLTDLSPPATPDELAASNSWMVVTHVCRHLALDRAFEPPPSGRISMPILHTASDTDDEWNDEVPILLTNRSFPAPLRFSCAFDVLQSALSMDEPHELYNAIRDNIRRMDSFHILSSPFVDGIVFEMLDRPLPRLSSLQLGFPNQREVIRDIETGIITSEADEGETELPSLFGGLQSDLETPILHDFLDMLEALPHLEVLHGERRFSRTVALPSPTYAKRTSSSPDRTL
ncbi:hypothetical protein M413DRAFT_28233 [Hebeloma cylindrosporum]|uniref:Uncharacterized protein n=1 Tax=Hebeloma cylindrosporum TaxID=76867 RepID=A0A0C2XU58_HEBCY|nr:hypothetical protein M413DRAFT_28233 [Hebeloma cylindrosporum h7]